MPQETDHGRRGFLEIGRLWPHVLAYANWRPSVTQPYFNSGERVS